MTTEIKPQHDKTPSELEQFDFWLGEWDLTWDDGGHGTNIITKILDGRVILENFDGYPGTSLKGMSVSTYHEGSGLWQQTDQETAKNLYKNFF